MPEEKKKPWYQGIRKLAFCGVALLTGVFMVAKGQYATGAMVITGAITAYTTGNLIERKLNNSKEEK